MASAAAIYPGRVSLVYYKLKTQPESITSVTNSYDHFRSLHFLFTTFYACVPLLLSRPGGQRFPKLEMACCDQSSRWDVQTVR